MITGAFLPSDPVEVLGRHARQPTGIAAMVLRRVAAGAGALLLTSALIFVAINLLPGDAATAVLGQDATLARVASLRTALHLDLPLWRRYFDWIAGLSTGDFGLSSSWLARDRSIDVWSLIGTPLRNSGLLVLVTSALFVPLSLLLGVITALGADRPIDHGISFVTLVISALPDFLIGTLLILVFFSWLDWLPPTVALLPNQNPFSRPAALILPVLTMTGTCLAFASRLVRAAVIEVLRQDYVAFARLGGVPEGRVILRHALRNALGPGIQGMAVVIRSFIGGLIVAESLFDYPGIGRELAAAVADRDVQVVSVITTILAGSYILLNLGADLLVIALNPRLRSVPR